MRSENTKDTEVSLANIDLYASDIEADGPAASEGRIVANSLLEEVSTWKREAKSEDNSRYFWHVNEVDQIARGDRYFVIGRKGSGKTAICEYFNRIRQHDVFAERLSFKSFPFNELYSQKNDKFTAPNEYITIWKYVIYSTVCRLMLKDESLEADIREPLEKLYGGTSPLSRLVGKWTSSEFGVSFVGFSLKLSKGSSKIETDWVERVSVLEDFLLSRNDDKKYFVLFDELDEDYRDIVNNHQDNQYINLITSLFKAVQDVRSTFAHQGPGFLFPVIFLRDDIYDLIQDADKNKWRDFRVDLSWDQTKIKKVVAFRISRAIDPHCTSSLTFEAAWRRLFGTGQLRVGKSHTPIDTFEFICRSTLLRPRDFVAYLQNCAEHALSQEKVISPKIVKLVDKAFSNYLREEFQDELFAILPDISGIFDVLSQLRKWNFAISEFEKAYEGGLKGGFISEKNVKFVLQVLFLFDVIGNAPRPNRLVFRYQNREARLNFNERVVVHRGLFKSLQIL